MSINGSTLLSVIGVILLLSLKSSLFVSTVDRFPYKTLTMVLSFATVIIVSYLTKYIFENRILPKNWDLFQCVVNFPDEMIVLKEATEGLRLTNGIPARQVCERSHGDKDVVLTWIPLCQFCGQRTRDGKDMILTNGIPPGAIVVPGAGGGVPPIPMPGHVKHNAPGGHINPHLKIHREDLLLLPSADYQRLIESRSPSPLPEHANRVLAGSDQLDHAVVAAAAAAAAAQTAGGDQSSIDSESEGAIQQPAASNASEDPAAATRKEEDQKTDKPAAARDHRSSVTRKHP